MSDEFRAAIGPTRRLIPIGLLILLLSASQALIVATEAIQRSLQQWRAYDQARAVQATNGLIDHLLQAGQNLAFERGRTRVALNSPERVSETNRGFIAARREIAAGELEPILSLLPRDARAQALRDRYAALAAMRQEVDAALDLPRAARDPDLSDRWVAAVTPLLGEFDGVIVELTNQYSDFSTRFRALSRLKLLAFRLREALGTESYQVASRVASESPLGHSGLSQIMMARGLAAATWRALRAETGNQDSPRLQEAVAAVDRLYFVTYRQLVDQVIEAGAPPYPISATDLTAASVPALDSIGNLITTAGLETERYSQATIDAALRALVLALAAAALAIGLGIASVLLLVRRLLRPLAAIGGALDRLSAGDTTVRLPNLPVGDEIGEMAQALRTFRESLLRRHEAEALLAESRDFADVVIASSTIAIAVFTAEGRCVLVNEAYVTLVGGDRAALLQQNFNEIASWRRSGLANLAQESLATGGQRRGILHMVTSYGREVWVEVHFSCLQRGGRPHLLMMASDVTEKKRDEAALAEAKQAAEAANEAKSTFLASMSHELRTPLNGIIGFAKLLQHRANASGLGARERSQIDYILQAGTKLLSLINDVLDYAKLEAGRLRVTLDKLDPADVIAETRVTLEPMVEAAGLTFSVSVPETPLPPLRADPGRVHQILTNFGSNAVKYNRPHGSVELFLELPDPAWIRIGIADTGFGIAPDRQAQAFQPFNRLGAEYGQIEGTGIGLSICDQLARLMGGTVGFASAEGEGSRFWVDLPAAGNEVDREVPG